MAAPRYSVLGLSLLALLLVTACSASIFSKDETKVSILPLPLRSREGLSRCTAPGDAHSAHRFEHMRSPVIGFRGAGLT